MHRPISLKTKFSVSNVRRNPTVTRFQGGEIQSRFLLGGKKGARVTRGFDKQRSTTAPRYIHVYIYIRVAGYFRSGGRFEIEQAAVNRRTLRGVVRRRCQAHASAPCNVAGAASEWRQNPLFAASWISGSLCSATTFLRRLYEPFLLGSLFPSLRFAPFPLVSFPSLAFPSRSDHTTSRNDRQGIFQHL